MMKRRTAFHSVAGVAVLSGALVFGACAQGGSTGSTSTNTSAASQQQAQMVLSRVQQNVLSGNLKNASVVSDTTFNTGQSQIQSMSKGELALQPFGVNWNTSTKLAGNTIQSNEIIANGNLYVRTGNNAYQKFSLANLASLAGAGSSGSMSTSGNSSGTMATAGMASSLQNFLNVSHAHLVCGNESAGTQSAPGSLSTSNTSTQACTVPYSASTLTGTSNSTSTNTSGSAGSISATPGNSVQAYEIQGTTVQNGSTSTNAAASTTETLYVTADGTYKPLGVTFSSAAAAHGYGVTVTSTTAFQNWNQGSSNISAPSNVANSGATSTSTGTSVNG